MSEINLPPFYVGQKVVALKSATVLGASVVKGNTYTVAVIMQCSCGKWMACVKEALYNYSLLPSLSYFLLCHIENYRQPYAGGDAKYFAPVQENFQSISLEKVIEKETPLVCVN